MAMEDLPPQVPLDQPPIADKLIDQPPPADKLPDAAPPPETLSATLTPDEKQWAMLCHLSAILGLLVGGLTFLGPLVCWLVKKDTSRFVDYHGKESLNFQLNILIYSLILVAISFATCGVAIVVTGPLLIALAVYAIVMPIIAGITASKGETYQYPYTFRLIK